MPLFDFGVRMADLILKKLENEKDENPTIYNAIKALFDEITTIRLALITDSDELGRYKDANPIQSFVFPRVSNPPPTAQPNKGMTFFDTARSRFNASVDSYDYYDFPTPESCRVFNSVDEVIPNNAFTAVTFDTERYDHFDMADLATNNTRITIPIDGRYAVGCNIVFDDDAVGRREVEIRLNGATVIARISQMPVTVATFETMMNLSTQYEFADNDYVEVLVLQTSGGNLNINAHGNYGIEFYCHRLG